MLARAQAVEWARNERAAYRVGRTVRIAIACCVFGTPAFPRGTLERSCRTLSAASPLPRTRRRRRTGPMDAHAGTPPPPTPSYSRDHSAAAAAANPSEGSFGFAPAGVPPSTGIARGFFMPPRMTLVMGGVASASAVPRAPSLEAPKCDAGEEGHGWHEFRISHWRHGCTSRRRCATFA